MKKFFGFGSSTPPPPAPPSKPPAPPVKPSSPPTPVTKTAPAPTPVTAAPVVPATRPIVGRWKDASGTGDGSESTEFHADGTVTERLAGGDKIHGRYELVGDNLTITLEGVDEALAFSFAVKGDMLEMEDQTGQRSTYRRV